MASAPEKKDDKNTLLAVLQYLKKNNFKVAEEALRKEVGVAIPTSLAGSKDASISSANISVVLSEYESNDGDPLKYTEHYTGLQEFVEKSLDIHKCELALVLYPVFVHMYLELVYKRLTSQADKFFKAFSVAQDTFRLHDLKRLETITKREHMQDTEVMSLFRSSKYVIKLSRESFNILKSYLQANNQEVILNLIQQQFHLDVFDGRPRSQRAIDRTSGYITGEASTEGSKQKVFYGLISDPDLAAALDEDSDDEEDKDKPKKKKSKKEEGKKRQAADPHAPKADRMPFPKLKDRDKKLKLGIYREISKRLHVSKDKVPSICFYTFLNANSNSVTCVAFNDASTILATGLDDSAIRVWSLSSRKLRTLKPTSELSRIDKEADDVMERVMNDKTAVEQRILYGHSGPVYALTFNEDDSCLLSASEDGTVRLWSLHAFACLVVYKGHNYPVWDVKFSPRGYYFATASHDRTARLWSVDSYQPLRIFAGHVADVTVVDFHPNCNYLATGSDDRSVRIWDLLTGNMVRMYTGHKGAVQCVSFSPDGKHVVSSGVDTRVMVWNISSGSPVAELTGHKNVVYTLCFSREGNVLASGGLDEYVKLWDMKKACRCEDEDDVNSTTHGNDAEPSALQIASFRTKSTPILRLQFSRKNLLLASGPFLLPT